MDLRTGHTKFDYDGFHIKLILASILLLTRPAESRSGFQAPWEESDKANQRLTLLPASFPEWIGYFVSTGKVASWLHHRVFNANVLHSERRDHAGLIGLWGERWNKRSDQSQQTHRPLPARLVSSAVCRGPRGLGSAVRLKGRRERGGINHSSGHVGSVKL